jgi:hypothetical protein
MIFSTIKCPCNFTSVSSNWEYPHQDSHGFIILEYDSIYPECEDGDMAGGLIGAVDIGGTKIAEAYSARMASSCPASSARRSRAGVWMTHCSAWRICCNAVRTVVPLVGIGAGCTGQVDAAGRGGQRGVHA